MDDGRVAEAEGEDEDSEFDNVNKKLNKLKETGMRKKLEKRGLSTKGKKTV
eukprot:SAG22_NODE_22057_length_252_cov_0.490196_1_plen_50_part_10